MEEEGLWFSLDLGVVESPKKIFKPKNNLKRFIVNTPVVFQLSFKVSENLRFLIFPK